ncbi:MAG: hypothetical protein ACO4CZ_15875, partial [Planctomycetota bacterium]
MADDKPLILVDGSSYLFRAFHALPPLTPSGGRPTGAIRGVVAMLRNVSGLVFEALEENARSSTFGEHDAASALDGEQARVEPVHLLLPLAAQDEQRVTPIGDRREGRPSRGVQGDVAFFEVEVPFRDDEELSRLKTTCAVAVAQIAALGGGWLVTALVGLVAGAAVDLVVRRDRAQAMSPATAVIALIAAVAYGHARIDAHDAAVRATPRPRLLVVQTNLPMSNKLAWTPEQQVEDFITFAKQTIDGAAAARDAGGPIDLALWPETTVPGLGLEPESIRMLVENGYYPGDRYEEALRDLAMRIDAPLLVGSPAYLGLRVEGNRFAWDHQFNSAYLVGSEGVLGRTDKIYLTPFGEIMPIISNWAWLESQLLALGADGMTFDLEEAKAASAFGVESDSAGACSIAVPLCLEIT